MRTVSFHLRIVFLLLYIALQTIADTQAGISYFDMREDVSGNLMPFPKWTGTVARFHEQQKISHEECGKASFHPCVIPQWKELVRDLRGEILGKKLEEVNNWANAHPYIVDQLNWGLSDYWATPYEFMEVNGDCEDYAIAKYYSLLAAGVSEERMRIMIVQDLNLGGIIHAILGVYDGDRLWILDNQIKQVVDAQSIYHYRPIYGVNTRYWWRYHPKNEL